MPNSPKKPAPGADKSSAPLRPRLKPAKRRFDSRDLGRGKGRGKPSGGRPNLFPGRTGGR